MDFGISTFIDKINDIVRKDKTKSEFTDYFHACAFSPVLPIFHQAICNQNFVTWPSIDTINFEKLWAIKHPFTWDIWIKSVPISSQQKIRKYHKTIFSDR